MKISKLEEKLYNFFIKNDQEVVIALNGEWGSGKTYFWQSIFLDKYNSELNNKQIANVSLFAHNSLNGIKTDIILQISKHTKYISKIQDKVKSLEGIVFRKQNINISLGGGVIENFLFDPLIFSGFASAFIASFFWMAAMTKFELSYAYPFMSRVFVLVLKTL